jgi:phage-related protein
VAQQTLQIIVALRNQLTAGVRQAQQNLVGLGRSADDAARSADRTENTLRTLAPAAQSAGRASESAAGNFRDFGGSMLSASAGADALSGVLDTASQALSAIASGFTDVLGGAISLNASFESSTAVIQAYTGSQEETERIMSMLQERAANSVFSFDEMAQAVQGLIPASRMAFVPVDELMTVAEQLGASNMAEGIDGAAFALREAVSGDFTSVIERFNLPRSAINALKEQGVPALDIIRSVMSDLGISMDLVSAQANTFNGRSDRLIENLQLMAADAAKPIFDLLSESLEDVIELMGEPEFQEFADTIKEIVANTVLFIVGVRDLAAMIASSGDPLATFLDNIDLLIPSIDQFVGKGREISAMLRPITTFIMNNLLPILGTLAAVIGGALIAAFVALVAPIAKIILIGGGIVAAIAGIGIGIKTLVETVQRDFPQVATIITDIFNDVVAIFQTVFAIIVALVEPVLKQIVDYWNKYGAQILQVVGVIFGVLLLAFQTGMKVLRGAVELILALIRGDWKGAGDAIMRIVNAIWNFIRTIFGGILTFLIGLAPQVWNAIVNAFDGAVKAAGKAIEKLLAFVINTWNSIKNWLTGSNGKIDAERSAKSLVDSFSNWLTSTTNGIVKSVTDAFEYVKAWLRTATLDAALVAKTLIKSFFDWLVSTGNGLTKFLGDAFDKVKTWLSTATQNAAPVAQKLIKSFFDWLVSTGNGLTKFLGDAFDRVKTWISTFNVDAGAIAKTIVASLLAVLIGPAGLVAGAAVAAFNGLTTWLGNRKESGSATGGSVVDSLKKRMSSTTEGLTKAASDAFNGLSTWLGQRTESGAAAGASIVDSVKTRMQEAGSGLSAIVGAVFDGLGTFLKDIVAKSQPLLDAAKSIGAAIVSAVGQALKSATSASPGLQLAVRNEFEALRAYLANTVRLSLGTTMEFVGKSMMRSFIVGIRANADDVFKNIVQPVVAGINRNNQLLGIPERVTVGTFSNAAPLPSLPVLPPSAVLPVIREGTPATRTTGATVNITIGSVRDQRDIDAIERAVTRGMSEAARRGIVQSQLPRGT